jgi:hypothetical protein
MHVWSGIFLDCGEWELIFEADFESQRKQKCVCMYVCMYASSSRFFVGEGEEGMNDVMKTRSFVLFSSLQCFDMDYFL